MKKKEEKQSLTISNNYKLHSDRNSEKVQFVESTLFASKAKINGFRCA